MYYLKAYQNLLHYISWYITWQARQGLVIELIAHLAKRSNTYA